MDTTRLLISRFDVGKRIIGNMIMIVTIGIPIITGVMKEANRFSFIFFLKGWVFYSIVLLKLLRRGGSGFWKFLIEIE